MREQGSKEGKGSREAFITQYNMEFFEEVPQGLSKWRPTKKLWVVLSSSAFHYCPNMAGRSPSEMSVHVVRSAATSREATSTSSATSAMQLNVHRLRFSNWQPSPIKTLASDPFSCKLAVGREDGDIEIRDASNKWYVQATAPGQKDFNLQALTWATEKSESGRLFGISLRGFIFELDLSTLKVKNIRDSYGGAAWCLASCPRHSLLAIGCEDGAARLFRYDSGGLEYTKSLPTTGSRILCIAFHPVLPRLFLGCDDGTIRCFDENNGRCLFTMVGDVVRGVSTYIWSIKVLSDSTVVTGDSRGHVQLWDGETGVLMVTLHQHTAEILALAVSPDECQIFASGVDCRVTCVRKVSLRNLIGPGEMLLPSDNNWVYSTSHNPHSHDVLALEICNTGPATAQSPGGMVLISGGVDTKICLYSIDEFARTRPFCILPISAKGLIQSSADYETVAVRHQDRIEIWNLSPSPFKRLPPRDDHIALQDQADEDQSRCSLSLLLEMKGPEHIHCFAMSLDASFLSCSTTSETRIWSLRPDEEGIDVQKLLLPDVARGFCHVLAFSADGRRLAAYTAKGELLLLSLTDVPIDNNDDDDDNDTDEDSEGDDDNESVDNAPRQRKNKKGPSNGKQNVPLEMETQVSLWHSFDHSELIKEMTSNRAGSSHAYALERAVTQIVFSADGMYLAVADAQNTVYVYDIDRLRLHWRLPVLSSPVTSVSFHPRNNMLIVTQADNSFLVYEADEMNLSEWSKSNNTEIIKRRFSDVKTVFSGVTFDAFAENSVILYSFGCLVFIDLTQGIPASCKVVGHRNRNHIGGEDGDANGDDRAKKFTRILNGRGNSGVRGGLAGKGRGKSGRISSDDAEYLNYFHANGNGDSSDAKEEIFANGTASTSTGKRTSNTVGIVESNGIGGKQSTPSKHLNAGSSNGAVSHSSRHDSAYGPSHDNDSAVLAVGENSTIKVRKNTCTFSVVMRYKSLIHIGFAPGKHLIVFENPWVNVLSNLPDVLARKRFGT